ncbi:hypothetical protein P618_200781 [Holospora obtusa F1]|uniref:Uncharacterized protein n=1 Tax=Holospora obtusa F1 TaxID=1399147 RepID=W6TTD7_HOLOB|nr:hypothetical protein [Holospora obtusa]ETZ07047.1 hypothetical protein P618_200781 [Holospora obtusa F1]
MNKKYFTTLFVYFAILSNNSAVALVKKNVLTSKNISSSTSLAAKTSSDSSKNFLDSHKNLLESRKNLLTSTKTSVSPAISAPTFRNLSGQTSLPLTSGTTVLQTNSLHTPLTATDQQTASVHPALPLPDQQTLPPSSQISSLHEGGNPNTEGAVCNKNTENFLRKLKSDLEKLKL